MNLILNIFSLVIILFLCTGCKLENNITSKNYSGDYLDEVIEQYLNKYPKMINIISEKENSRLLGVDIPADKMNIENVGELKKQLINDGWVYKGMDGNFDVYCLDKNNSLTIIYDSNEKIWGIGLYYTKFGISHC